MAQIIDIAVPWEELERRRARQAAANHLTYVDRVPVVPGIAERYWLHAWGRTWRELTAEPRRMLEWQVRAHKWVLENVPGDGLGVGPSATPLSFYGESYALGCELGQDALTPWIASHPVREEADLDRLAAIDPVDNRYTALMLDWKREMERYLGDYRFCYADGVVVDLPERLSLGWGSIGIFTLAADLRGPELYVDLYARPAWAHAFLDVVADKVIARYRWLASERPGGSDGTYLVDDSSGNLSPKLYRAFVYPRVQRVVEAIGRPLRIHIDAPANHLLPFYHELGVQDFPGFGWGTSLEKVRQYLGGRAKLTGNLDPAMLLQGTPVEVYDAAMQVLRILAPCGGLVLSEGANVAPGTPRENIAAMLRASEDYGLPEVLAAPTERPEAQA
jgi:hypothetical protein